MGIIESLTHTHGQKDEALNIELATTIAVSKNITATAELVKLLHHPSKNTQSDAIKVLYEIGNLQPTLIAPYLEEFITFLSHKNNRLQWGAMTAIKTITPLESRKVFQMLPTLEKLANEGSVITRDNYVRILVSLATLPIYQNETLYRINQQLARCPLNQLPMYAEWLPLIAKKGHNEAFIKTLEFRKSDLEKESKIKRIDKVLIKLNKMKR